MEWFIVTGYAALCIAVFTILRVPLNRWTLPAASIGGLVMTFALVQLLNFYHPYSDTSRQVPGAADFGGPETDAPLAGARNGMVAWFRSNSRFRLDNGRAAEVTFDSLPGLVFSAEVRTLLPATGAYPEWESVYPEAAADGSRVPVLIDITDSRYEIYASRLGSEPRAQAAVYGSELQQLALVRKTLLRMSAWMNYLSPLS